MDDWSFIARYAVVQSVGGKITLGKRVAIGDFCSIYGQGGLSIGDDTMVSSHVSIVPNQHTFQDLTRPISFQVCISKGVSIGCGVWIGIGATVLDGVSIGDGAIVGAGAVVTKNVDANSIVAGVPARLLRMR